MLDVMAGLIELSRVLVAPGEQVAFFTPAYPPFFVSCRRQESYLLSSPDCRRRSGSPCIGGVVRRRVRILVLTNPHNPTGQIVSQPVLEQIAELCVTYAAWVLADEIHALWSWRERPIRHGLFQMQRVSAALLTSCRRRSMWQG